MRKRNFKLIRKTLVWYHRRKGTSSVNIPENINSERYQHFNILGCDAQIEGSGVGDYDEALSSYVIPFHAHGKNLMGGEEFMAIHSDLGISKIPLTIVSECYSTTPLPEHNGTVVIGPQHVKFKKKTAYTLALHMKYFTSSSKRSFGLRFEYSDGSYDFPIIATGSRDLKVCLTSDPTKDLVAISSHTETATNIRFNIAGFGLYEGTYTDYYNAYEAYYGNRFSIALNAPLFKIDYAADVMDILSGKLTRKIHRAVIDGSLEFKATDDEGVFEVTLPVPMRAGSRIVSTFGELTAGCDIGLSAFGDGEKILFKPGMNITLEEEIVDFLNTNPIEIMYIMRDYQYEELPGISIPTFQQDVTLDILSSKDPSKAFAEYV